MSCFVPTCTVGNHLLGVLTTQWRLATEWRARHSCEHMGAHGCSGCQLESASYAATTSSTSLRLVSLLSHRTMAATRSVLLNASSCRLCTADENNGCLFNVLLDAMTDTIQNWQHLLLSLVGHCIAQDGSLRHHAARAFSLSDV